jgi:hypothetical protein
MRKAEALEMLIGKAGEDVPTVDPTDVKAVWSYHQELKMQHPGKQVGVDLNVLARICTPGADIRAVSYRCTTLHDLEQLLAPAWTGGNLSENALKVAAKMYLQRPPIGVVQNGFPFHVEEFLAEVQGEAT